MAKAAIFRHNLFVPSETFIRAQAFALRSYEPVFVSRRPAHGVPDGARVWSLSRHQSRVADSLYSLTARSPALTSYFESERFDVVHAHFGPDALYASAAARKADVPLIATFHGRDVTVRPSRLARSGRPIAVRYAFGRRALGDRAAVLLCVSEEIRRAALTAGFPESRLRTHYIGVDTELYRGPEGERPPTVVTVARLVEKKGTAYLVRAFARVAARHPDARLRIVGEGPLEAALKQQAAELGIADRVDFLGRLSADETRAAVAEARIFALPSVTATDGDREGLPISLIEAMSLGCAVVATRHSGIPEAVSSDAVGRLVEERDVEALAGELHALLADAAGAKALGEAAAQHVRAHFNLVAQTAELERIYAVAR